MSTGFPFLQEPEAGASAAVTFAASSSILFMSQSPGAALVCKPSVNRQNHLVRLWLIGESFPLSPARAALFSFLLRLHISTHSSMSRLYTSSLKAYGSVLSDAHSIVTARWSFAADEEHQEAVLPHISCRHVRQLLSHSCRMPACLPGQTPPPQSQQSTAPQHSEEILSMVCVLCPEWFGGQFCVCYERGVGISHIITAFTGFPVSFSASSHAARRPRTSF